MGWTMRGGGIVLHSAVCVPRQWSRTVFYPRDGLRSRKVTQKR